MAVQNSTGTRLTRATVPTTPYVEPNPKVVVSEDLYRTVRHRTGSETKELLATAGTVVPEVRLDSWFPPASVHAIDPASGPVAGLNTVTLRGAGLDAVSAVTFGGAAATDLTLVDAGEVTVTVPAAPGGVAGPVDVVLTDDAGQTTITDGYTYE